LANDFKNIDRLVKILEVGCNNGNQLRLELVKIKKFSYRNKKNTQAFLFKKQDIMVNYYVYLYN